MEKAKGHRPHCRAAIFAGTRFEGDWPKDPERCDLACTDNKQIENNDVEE